MVSFCSLLENAGIKSANNDLNLKYNELSEIISHASTSAPPMWQSWQLMSLSYLCYHGEQRRRICGVAVSKLTRKKHSHHKAESAIIFDT